MSIAEHEGGSFIAGQDHQEFGRRIRSLIPLGVAFVFYSIFLLPADIANKDTLYVVGAAAGFSGVQAYWAVCGWKRKNILTVALGVIGIAVAFGHAWMYMGFK